MVTRARGRRPAAVILITALALPAAWARPFAADSAPALADSAAVSADSAAVSADSAAVSADSAAISADYELLQRWRYTSEAIALPAGGVRFEKDVASWTLDRGTLRFAEPTADGAVTGLFFEGEGRFRMEIPDPVELAQLARLRGDTVPEPIDERFTRLVLRTSDSSLLTSLAAGGSFDSAGGGPAPTYRTHRLVRQRHEHWLGLRYHDADARVIASRSNPGAEYLRVDVGLGGGAWLTFEFDSGRHEEIHLERFQPRYSFLENWVSLDRAEHRGPGGRPAVYAGAAVDLEHVEVVARLVKTGKDPGTSETARATLLGEFSVVETLRPTVSGARAVQFYLHPMARVDRVFDERGRPLVFLRDHIGGRSLSRDNRLYDFSLLVLLDEPLAAGVARKITFEYEYETTNYGPGRVWYPTIESGFVAPSDHYTATLELTTREAYEARAMGERESETVDNGVRTARWRVERPAKMISFSVARKAREWVAAADAERGLPEVVVFGPPQGHDPDRRMKRLGEEIQRALAFFTELLGVSLPAERLYASLIQASHGQAFDGLLHLGEFSAYRERSGPIEVFLAHEVAHQWWGHLVGWSSYRDQWLSEGLAHYLALMYLERQVDRGPELFREALAAHRDDLIGSLRTKMSPFSRGLALDSKLAFDRIGPIGHGFRAAVRESPNGYFAQSYLKGALVMHMLRTAVGDETFVAILRDFASRWAGGNPTTADLAAIVSEHTGADWSWFFHQWVERAEIPTHRFRSRPLPVTGGLGPRLQIEVTQSGVPEGFRVDLPIRVGFADGTEDFYFVTVDQPSLIVSLDLPQPSRRVAFDPDRAVLARGRRN